MSRNVLLLPGDNIGIEIVAEAEKVLHAVNDRFQLGLSFSHGLIGGQALISMMIRFRAKPWRKPKLLTPYCWGLWAGPKWDSVERHKRPGARFVKNPQ